MECDLYLSRPADEVFISDTLHLSREIQLNIPDPMQEIYMAEAVYLWQYLTRSNLGGFFIALSGGLDSASVSLFVYGMAKVVLQSVKSGDERTLSELRRITGEKDLVPETPQDIVSRLLHTCYMGTVNSGEHTRSRAKRLAARIGAFHSDVNIDETVSAHEAIIKQAMNFEPKFQVEGGSVAVSCNQGVSACVCGS